MNGIDRSPKALEDSICMRIFFTAFLIFLTAELCFASIFGNVRGAVHDPDGRPIQGAQISLRATASDWSKASQTTPDGEFEFSAVPVGEYLLTVRSEGFTSMDRRIVVTSGSALVLRFQLRIAVAQQI